MTMQLVRVATFNSEIEADHVRSVLRENGILSYVDGGTTNTMLSHVGSALGGVRLLTSSADAGTARDMIESLRFDTQSHRDPWYCGRCQQEVDAGFDVCWSCGGERDEVGALSPAVDAESVPSQILPLASSTLDASRDLATTYCPPGQVMPDRDNRGDTSQFALLYGQELTDAVARAHRAAWLAFIVLPCFVLPYAVYLLAITARYSKEFTPRDRRRWNRGLAAAILGGGLWIFGVSMWYFQLRA